MAGKSVTAAPSSAPSTLHGLLDSQRGSLGGVLPKNLTVERFIRSALATVERSSELRQCTSESLCAAIMQAAYLGLEVGLLNQAHLVPFWSSARNRYEATFLIGYLGLRDLAERYGDIVHGGHGIVYALDAFAWREGTSPTIDHTPSREQDRGEPTHYYAWAAPKSGLYHIAVLTRTQVVAHRDQYVRRKKDGTFGEAWGQSFDAMGLRTVMRQLYKFLARSPQLREAIAQDELVEREDALSLEQVSAGPALEDARAANREALAALTAPTPAPVISVSPPVEAAPVSPQAVAPMPRIPFGRHKGKSLDNPSLTLDDLYAQMASVQRSIDNPASKGFLQDNLSYLDELKEEVARRQGAVADQAAQAQAESPIQSDAPAAPWWTNLDQWRTWIMDIDANAAHAVIKQEIKQRLKITNLLDINTTLREAFLTEAQKAGIHG